MDYEKKYKEALELARVAAFNGHQSLMEGIFPELAESEDEKIRKELIDIVAKSPITFAFEDKNKVLSWLEKQDTERKQLYVRFGDIPSNEKSKIYHGEEEIGDENGVSVYPAFELNGNIVLGLTLPITKTTLYTQQHLLEYDNRPCYLVSGDYVGKGTDGEPLIKNISVIKRLDNYRIKECEKKPAIEMKSAEESLGIDSETYNKIVDECIYGEQKSIDKVEPKFKIKYSGSEYNVLEVKDIAGVTYYGIEDEPNHIDYVLPDNCEIISGYSVKEKGSPYPTKSAIFSEQNPALSEENDNDAWMNDIISKVENNLQLNKAEIDWLKSLKNRIKGE